MMMRRFSKPDRSASPDIATRADNTARFAAGGNLIGVEGALFKRLAKPAALFRSACVALTPGGLLWSF